MKARNVTRILKHAAASLIALLAVASVPASDQSQPSGSVSKTAASNHPPAHQSNENEGGALHKSTDREAPSNINPALRNASATLSTDNILDASQGDAEADPIKHYQSMLDQAIQHKREKQFTLAEELFVRVLNSDAPVELHRTACLELALMAQDNKQNARAQQIFSQFASRFPDDPDTAEVMLRQGLLYREMGAPVMALSKFYAVMTTALRLKLDRLDYYKRLVLQAQTEIADTYYLQGKYGEAAEFQQRLLKLDSPLLNRSQIVFKLIRSLAALKRDSEVVAQSDVFLAQYSDSADLAEVRFLMADSLKKLGRTRDAMQQVLLLLKTQQAASTNRPADWVYWQQRTGNDIANQLYKEGDYVNSLEIYRTLSMLNTNVTWQTPAWYQMGLVYERLQQPQKAADIYGQILAREKEATGDNASASLGAVFDMSRWRKEHLEWQLNTERKTVLVKAGNEATAATR